MWGPRVHSMSFWGDGTYSGNIMQGGVALQPQDYLLDGVTPYRRCIVVTNTATVVPDATTGAAAAMCTSLVIVGASASLSASTSSKGLIVICREHFAMRNGAHLHMDQLGKAGNYGALTPYGLLPKAMQRRIAPARHAKYIIQPRGAEGGAASSANGVYNAGNAAGPMQTGGGGVGYPYLGTAAHGGCGGPCSGGAASGGANTGTPAAPGDFGGPGGSGGSSIYGAGGGAGDPPGAANPGTGATTPTAGSPYAGGLLAVFAPDINIGAGCVVSADGAQGGAGNAPGGGSGGGLVLFVSRPGGYVNNGTVRAAGGLGGLSAGVPSAGPGGVGSINVYAEAA